MTILKSDRFQKEYKEFQEKINKINDTKAKAEVTFLLNQLVAEVRAIDAGHAEMFNGSKLPSTLSDHRSGLTSIRKKLISKLSECEHAGLMS